MNITNLTEKQRQFLTFLSSNNKSRTPEVSLSLGFAIATRLAIPSSPIEDLLLFFKTQHQISADSTIYAFNEITILDKESVLSYVQKFYQHRYNSIYPKQGMFALNKERGLIDFFGLSKTFSEVELSIISEDPVTLTDYINNFQSIIDTLKLNQVGSEF